MFQKCSGMEKRTIVKRVVSRFLVKSFLSRSAEDTRKGDPCVSETFCYGKKVMDNRERITFFRRKFSVSQRRKKNLEETFCA